MGQVDTDPRTAIEGVGIVGDQERLFWNTGFRFGIAGGKQLIQNIGNCRLIKASAVIMDHTLGIDNDISGDSTAAKLTPEGCGPVIGDGIGCAQVTPGRTGKRLKIVAHGHNQKTFGTAFLIQGFQVRNLRTAVASPGGKEIDQENPCRLTISRN
jgi:hypothetical protein